MKLQISKLTGIAYGTREDGSLDLNVINARVCDRQVKFTRRMSGWNVRFIILMDDRIIHDDMVTAEDKVAWAELADKAHEVFDIDERAKAAQRFEACNVLFGRNTEPKKLK